MELCLSGRILEKLDPRPDVPRFIEMARAAGYRGVGLRAWQLPRRPVGADLDAILDVLRRTGLRVCSLTIEAAAAESAVPIARALGCKVLQASGGVEQLAAAAARLDADMRLGPQMHTGGEFENVALAARTLKRIADPRVGVVVEPANLMFAGERWSARLFAPLAGRIVGCNLQSLEVGRGDAKLRLLDGTERAYQRVPAEQNTQADFPGFFAALRTVGYDGFVNVIEPADPARSVEDVASSTAECLRKAIRP